MNSASSDVADLSGVVFCEDVLDTQGPLLRVGKLLIGDISRGSGPLVGNTGEGEIGG